MRQKCIEQQTPPNGLRDGDVINHGRFFRNLKKDDVAKRYQGDDDNTPLYGFKITKDHWKSAERQGMLSVNLETCMHSGACSIAVHPNPTHYYHVAVLDLDVLNRVLCLSLVAQYRPEPEIQNRCHFEIMPLDGTTMRWMELRAQLDSPFPPAKKLPISPEDQAKAKAEYDTYRQIVQIRRWVRRQDGQLQPTAGPA